MSATHSTLPRLWRDVAIDDGRIALSQLVTSTAIRAAISQLAIQTLEPQRHIRFNEERHSCLVVVERVAGDARERLGLVELQWPACRVVGITGPRDSRLPVRLQAQVLRAVQEQSGDGQ